MSFEKRESLFRGIDSKGEEEIREKNNLRISSMHETCCPFNSWPSWGEIKSNHIFDRLIVIGDFNMREFSPDSHSYTCWPSCRFRRNDSRNSIKIRFIADEQYQNGEVLFIWISFSMIASRNFLVTTPDVLEVIDNNFSHHIPLLWIQKIPKNAFSSS